jgi:transcriptional regulator with XRE-family HTH domain
MTVLSRVKTLEEIAMALPRLANQEDQRVPSPPKHVVVSIKDIGARIKLLRQERGLTQVELGRKLGITQANLSAIECGRRGVTIHQVVKIAQGLRVSTDEILLADKAPEPGRRPRRRLMRRLQRMEELPPSDQKILLQLLDGLLEHREEKRRRAMTRVEEARSSKIPA